MLKFRTVFISILAAALLMSLSSMAANAQRPNPSAELVANARQSGPCRDPWITIAIWDNNGGTGNPQGVGDAGECDPNMYGGFGSWSSYDQLYNSVEPTIRWYHNNGYSWKVVSDGQIGGNTIVFAMQNGNVVAQQEIANNLLTSDGAGLRRIIASGGGNLISNLISNNANTFSLGNSVLQITINHGSNITINHGSNITVKQGSNFVPVSSYSFGSPGYSLQSAGSQPRSKLVIRR